MTHNLPGVTRDRHYGIAHFDEMGDLPKLDLILVDTGGFYPEPVHLEEDKKDNISSFFNIMIDHGKMAIEESDLILLVVDAREGLNPFDKMILDFIRREKKDFGLLVNKFDSSKQDGDETEFFELGINQDQMFLTSAEHGRGLDSLREFIHIKASQFLDKNQDEKYLQRGVKPRHEVVGTLAILGAPNAGKSTLLNALVGAERALVSDISGTTVDAIEAYISLNFGKQAGILSPQYNPFRKADENLEEEYQKFLKAGEDFIEPECIEISSTDEGWRSLKIMDTAGVRKTSKVKGYLESQSVYIALKAITESDIVLFLVDGTKGVTHQDRRLMDIAFEKGKSLIVLVNKSDLFKERLQNSKEKKEWLLEIRDSIPWLEFCDVLPLSAKNKSYFSELRKSISQTLLIRHRKIPTGPLNRHLNELVERNPVILKGSRGQRFRIKYGSMVKASPPTFMLFCNKSQGVPKNYRRYLQNGLRKKFLLRNSPVHLIFKS